MMGITMAVLAMRMMNMMLMKKLRRWRYLARYGYASVILEILTRRLVTASWRLCVYLMLLTGRRRSFTNIAAVKHIDLPA